LWEKDCGFLSALEPDEPSLLIGGFEYYKNAINYLSVIIIPISVCFITTYHHMLLDIMFIMYHYSISINNNKQ